MLNFTCYKIVENHARGMADTFKIIRKVEILSKNFWETILKQIVISTHCFHCYFILISNFLEIKTKLQQLALFFKDGLSLLEFILSSFGSSKSASKHPRKLFKKKTLLNFS